MYEAPNSPETMLTCRRWPVRKQFFSVRARAVPCDAMRLASSCFIDIFVLIDVGSGRPNGRPVEMPVGKLCLARYWKRSLQASAAPASRR